MTSKPENDCTDIDELFNKFSELSNGYEYQTIVIACIELILSCVDEYADADDEDVAKKFGEHVKMLMQSAMDEIKTDDAPRIQLLN